jgi:cytochrome c553
MQFAWMSLVMGVLFLIVVTALSAATPVAAAPQQVEKPTNESCLACHQQQGMTAPIGDQPIPITIDDTKYKASVHGTLRV